MTKVTALLIPCVCQIRHGLLHLPGTGDIPGRAAARLQAALAGLGRAADGRWLAAVRAAALPGARVPRCW